MEREHPIDALPPKFDGYHSVRKLHDRAMAIMDPLLLRRAQGRKGDPPTDQRIAARALIPEIVAAHRLATVRANEPSRSILYLSAASIAYHACAFAVARELIDAARQNAPHVPWHVEEGLVELEAMITAAEIGAC